MLNVVYVNFICHLSRYGRVEHLSLYSGPYKRFPRTNNWTEVEGGHVVISNIFSNENVSNCL